MEKRDIKYYEKRRDEIECFLESPFMPESYRKLLVDALDFANRRIQQLTDIAAIVDEYIQSN